MEEKEVTPVNGKDDRGGILEEGKSLERLIG